MNMQKIANNLKHQHRDFKPRISFEQELQRVKEIVEEKDLLLFDSLIGKQTINIRQKFKIYKRIIEGDDEKDLMERNFAVKYLVDIHIKQYIYGNSESKSLLMNTLKRIHQIQQICLEVFPRLFVALPIETYSQCRNILQILDMITRSAEERVSLNQKVANDLSKVVSVIIGQFKQGKRIIINESFKLKWMEYFVDILRSMNNVVRIFQRQIQAQLIAELIQDIREVLKHHKILTKEVLTQSYLLLLFINREQPPPSSQDNKLCAVHYLHACNVVKNINILQPLMQLMLTLKETDHKCQLVPILLKAFQTYYSTYLDKANVFDQVVSLFEVGRSIYAYLEEIISIIIKDPETHWSLQGNFVKKFFISTIVLKNNVGTHAVFKQWPTVIQDVITQAGSMIIPYATDCALILLTRLYEENGKDYKLWASRWMPQYKKCLLTSNRGQVRGVIEFINPILLSINSEPFLLKQILELNQQQKEGNLLIGVISLLKCFKQLGKISIDNVKRVFVHVDDPSIVFNSQQIKDLLLSLESSIALKALEFITGHLKSAQPMEPLQLELALQFYRYSLKTSLPEYRKSYLNTTKKMFERLRTVYENELTKSSQELKKNKRYKARQYWSQFKQFLQKLITLCYENVFPDVIFELANPALQILLLISTYFGLEKLEVKKGQVLDPSHILASTTYFEQANFQNLLCCLQSSYESVRLLAHQILRKFHNLSNTDQLLQLWTESLVNANRLTIKSYEYACRILAFISQSYSSILTLPNKYTLRQLNICQLFLTIIQERYEVFKSQFATQEQDYYKNLIHGILTVFSYSFDHLADQIRDNPEYFKPHFTEIRQFLNEFFDQMNQIILFSVEICSSNISTVVLDSLPQSQTDKKYKVDCRGHFLQKTSKVVGDFFQSPALLTSMQNQEQGIQNMLVVSFYLLTREAGLVFTSIGNLVGTNVSNQYIPNESLVQLVNTYFYALINLKHMGSVDRISSGLAKMAKVIFDNEDKQLNGLPEKLLSKLLVNLEEGNFTNILRRSAGVPYAFTCLLKSEALCRKQMISKTITTLLSLSEEKKQSTIELRIHSLNILKKLFQDGDLKNELDPYVSAAFISSIKGFTGEEWGVRNSSLMLFSVLANRTVGIKPTFNLLEFFHKCPDLLVFFTEQLENTKLDTMYPPLYPIVLLLSRLLPFDLKDKPILSNKGEMNLKQIRKQSLLRLLPLLERAGLNNNYMGRVMTAKAILPFMEINNIIPYCLTLLQQIPQITSNNLLHYKLTTCYQLFTSLHQIVIDEKFELKISEEVSKRIQRVMISLTALVGSPYSAVVSESLVKIIHHIIEYYRQYFNNTQSYNSVINQLMCRSKAIMKQYFKNPNLIISMNMGDSMATKEILHLHLDLLYKYRGQPDMKDIVEAYAQFLHFLKIQISQNDSYLKVADTEIIEYYLQKIVEFILQFQKSKLLEHSIREVIDKLDFRQIGSDNVLIQILNLHSLLKIPLSSPTADFLNELQQITNNHFLKIAIFKYLEAINRQNSGLLGLLHSFSRPQQLEQLRECCVEYFENCPHLEQAHYIVLIRLLEDEQPEIRIEMAKIMAMKLKLPQINQQVLKDYILQRLTVQGFERLLEEASDYQVKAKNNQQERIFSYDKPNKYRSDISNVIYCLLHNPNILKDRQLIASAIERQAMRLNLQWSSQIRCIQKYGKDIINRNEFQFQTIIRVFLLQQADLKQKLAAILESHPLLRRIRQTFLI